MGYKLFRDGRCVICGKPSTYYCDATGKYYCNEHAKEENPFSVASYPEDPRATGKHKYRWGKDVTSRKPKFQVNRSH